MGYAERKLPKEWTEEMDSFICGCDARDVDPKVVVRTLKERFPVLKTVAGQISVNKIELRVKLLDQIPEIKYFKPSAVARYRQAVEEGRIKDKYPEDVAYLNSEEVMKDSQPASMFRNKNRNFDRCTGTATGKHVRTLSGGFLVTSPSRNETGANHQAPLRESNDNSAIQATSLLDQLRDRSDPPRPPRSPPLKLSPAKEAARARAENLKERMQVRHCRGSSSVSDSQGLRLCADNANTSQTGFSSSRAVDVKDGSAGMSPNAISFPGMSRV